MSKPTSTALNIDDGNSSSSNVNPQHGDADSQDEVTRKSHVTSASAARSSRRAIMGAADYTEEAASTPPNNITVVIDAAGNFSCYPGRNVTSQGTVTLKSNNGVQQDVYTYVSTSLSPAVVFTTGAPPYSVNGAMGTTYTLASGLTGEITFTLTQPGSYLPNVSIGSNGTINVGGGGGSGSGGKGDGPSPL